MILFDVFLLLAGTAPFLMGLYALKIIRDAGSDDSDDDPPPPDPEPPRPRLPAGPSRRRPAGDRGPRRVRSPRRAPSRTSARLTAEHAESAED
jgi:hypothetical protein